MRHLMKILGIAPLAVLIGYVVICRFVPVVTTPYMIAESFRQGDIKRNWVPLDSLPRHVAASIIAAEDAGFCAHHGIEWGVLRDVIKNGENRGGSTISQQMVKNMLLWQGSGWSRYPRKAIEVPLTWVLEIPYSKHRIMEVYLNIIEFDTGVFGVEAAAQHHFGVGADQLSAHQAALLAAVLPNPKNYSAVPAGQYVARRAYVIEMGAKEIVARNLDECIL